MDKSVHFVISAFVTIQIDQKDHPFKLNSTLENYQKNTWKPFLIAPQVLTQIALIKGLLLFV